MSKLNRLTIGQQSTRVLVAAVLSTAIAIPAFAQTWNPPIGIPMPAFGVNERARAVPNPWSAETPGFYYIDNTSANAGDVTYGTPARPRRTIPPSVPAGSVVEVHGGPYTHSVDLQFGGAGTASQPIFYRGVGAPKIQTTGTTYRLVGITGSYVVMEGFDFINSPPRLEGDFLTLRDNEVRDRPPAPGGAGIYTAGSRDSVILRNHIHNNGDPNYHEENDIHGVQVAAGALRIWIVDNHMHHNGGDSVQVNSGINGTLARYIYIGRNEMHDEGENAVDIKTAEDVIISQNTAYNFDPTNYPSSGSDGSAIVINDDNIHNGLNNRVWVIFNRIRDSRHGIRTQAFANLIGNIIYRMQGNGVTSFGSHTVHIENNTFYSVGQGLDRSGGSAGFRADTHNNIVMQSAALDVSVLGNAADPSAMTRWLFASSAKINWAGRTTTGLAAFRSANPGKCDGCKEGDPQFVNPAAGDFRLASTSPAIDGGSPSSMYSQYQSLYGVSIAVDADGRPRSGTWDIGAIEGGGGGTTTPPPTATPPAAPTNVRIIR